MLRLHRLVVVVFALALSACASRSARRTTANPRDSIPIASTPEEVHHALARLTFGELPGQAERLGGAGLEGWLREQFEAARAPDVSRAEAAARYPLAFEPPLTVRFGAPDAMMDTPEDEPPVAATPAERRGRAIVDTQLATLLQQATSERQLDEVLVDFWSNHFNVTVKKGPCAFVTANYVETAIRPRIRGRFEDMLVAVAQHPAMLVYLDNAQSSTERPGAHGEHGGLNENYARELLELHTLGVDGGYTQVDVREAARVLTGWGEAELAFTFRAAWHDPGEKTVLGHHFEAGRGADEGLELLHLLARHPSTARFIARKLLQRFVSDTPTDEAVARIAAVFTATEGDLREVTRAVIFGPEFWSPANRGTKLRSGLEFFLAAIRSTGAVIEGPEAIRALDRLGQAPFGNPIPTGYPEVAAAWADPGVMTTRWAIGYQLANNNLPGVAYARPPALSADDVARVLTAPEFQTQ